MKIIKNKAGFTLIEMLVASVLFLIAITTSIGIFLSTVRANNRINAMQEVENEIRYIVEVISKEIRLGIIYYDYYEEIYGESFENPVSILALEDNAHNVSYFALNGDSSSPGIVQMSLNGLDWSDLSTDSIVVDSLDFYLSPAEDPFSQDSTIIRQPLIVLNLNARYNRGEGSEGQIRIQTAIGSRQYKK